jgi:hypothetical protein
MPALRPLVKLKNLHLEGEPRSCSYPSTPIPSYFSVFAWSNMLMLRGCIVGADLLFSRFIAEAGWLPTLDKLYIFGKSFTPAEYLSELNNVLGANEGGDGDIAAIDNDEDS